MSSLRVHSKLAGVVVRVTFATEPCGIRRTKMIPSQFTVVVEFHATV